jgi:hypothetical protein
MIASQPMFPRHVLLNPCENHARSAVKPRAIAVKPRAIAVKPRAIAVKRREIAIHHANVPLHVDHRAASNQVTGKS